VTSALVLTYHAIEAGPSPLCIAPELFREHVAVLAEGGASFVTASELTAALRAGELPEKTVCLTFDDGFASVVEHAAPALAERGVSATVFCVAGYLDGFNDWRTQPASAPRLRLASNTALAGLAAAGWEIGAHGFEHDPLDRASAETAELEIVQAKELLERTIDAPVRSFALPYNAPPTSAAGALLARTYESAFGGGLRPVSETDNVYLIPRVDAHYLRRADRLRRAVEGGLDTYLAVRRLGARTRRLVGSGY
jgi:peptidoglycan/xylan/chitin deacetylase (PgdA/CDA1 family)